MRRSLKANYIYNLIYQIIAMLTPFITTPYISRILGAKGIGEYSYGLSIVTYFSILGTLGITTYGQIEIAKIRDNLGRLRILITEVMIARILTMFISCIAYGVVVVLAVDHKKILFVLVLYLLSQISDISWILQGLEEFQSLVARNIVVKIINILFIFILIKSDSDLYLYAGLMQGIVFVGNFFLWPNIWKFLDFSKNKISFYHLLKHWKGSMVYFIPTVATTIYTVLDKSMIGWITHSDIQNGYYEQAHKIEQILVVGLTSLGTVTLPRITNMYINHDNVGIKRIMEKSIKLVLFISVPMCFGLMGIVDIFIPIFLGKGYDECIVLTKIFSLLIIVVGLDNTIGRQCLMAMGRQKLFNIGVIFGALLNFTLNLLLIPSLGALGAVISSVCSEMLILGLFLYFSRDFMKFNIISSIYKYIIASILMYILVKYIGLQFRGSLIILFVQIVLGILCYLGVLLILNENFAKVFIAQLFMLTKKIIKL